MAASMVYALPVGKKFPMLALPAFEFGVTLVTLEYASALVMVEAFGPSMVSLCADPLTSRPTMVNVIPLMFVADVMDR
jgi:hypothetical protein